MAAKKFGTFGGVFTPSILTILGVIMYMRLGWVVGNAGLIGAILLIVVAHVISITTGLSISSIATDKKVGAGGVYYVLSRSLGLPIGGAIGVTLWVATALSIALYLVGFAESFNAYLGLDTSIMGLRISGTIALASLAAIAIISTSFAIKAQYFIMGAIALSLISIFAGTWEFAPAEVPSFGPTDGLSMMTIFAILFPAVTGFTAGIAMSGDLENPKKSIPGGTIAAIAVGFVVYVAVAVFMAYAIDPEMLRTDYNVLMKIALFAPAVVAGIWGATLSSALGGILGGPRILQAMSIDRITPKLFGNGVGKDNEPRNALLITLLIAEGGVLIGELDMIAEVCSMFYLAAYGFINISFFLESWASADFSPSFKVKRWVGLLGFIATFAVMFQLNPGAMVAAFVVIGGIYAYLQRKQLALSSGDVWTSVWSSLVMKGLKRMDATDDSSRNWKPNILLFSGGTENRPYLIEISKAIAGKVGMVSNFDLVENPDAEVLFPKHKQSVHDPVLKEHGIFGRKQEVKNVFQGIETIASTYGFSGVEPNTIMLGWAKNTKDPLWFAQMTQKLIALDYNVLYLDYDPVRKFGKYQRIDIWWHNLRNNAELTLNLVKFISRSEEWHKASIRIVLINDTSKEGFERRIRKMLDEYRIEATVKVVNNKLMQKTSYELMKSESQDADLIIAGIPEIPEGQEREFVDRTTEMFESIATTLLVKTSSTLGEDVAQLRMDSSDGFDLENVLVREELSAIPVMDDADAQAVFSVLSEEVERSTTDLIEDELASFENVYLGLVKDCRKVALDLSEESENGVHQENRVRLLDDYQKRTEVFLQEDIPYLHERLNSVRDRLLGLPSSVSSKLATRIKINGKKRSFKNVVATALERHYLDNIKQIQLSIGLSAARMNEQLKDGLIESEGAYALQVQERSAHQQFIKQSFDGLAVEISKSCLLLKNNIKYNGREFLSTVIRLVSDKSAQNDARNNHPKKVRKALMDSIIDYPQHWQRNTELLTAKLSTDLKLHRIQLIIEQIGAQVGEEVDLSMFAATKQRLSEAQAWYEGLESKAAFDPTDIPEVDQSLTYDDIRIHGLLSWAEVAGQELPEQLELMQPESLNEIAQEQGESVASITIDSLSSYTHLLSEVLDRPIQKHLSTAYQHSMEVLSKVQYDINQISQKVTLQKEAIAPSQVRDMATSAKANLQDLSTVFGTHEARLTQLLNDLVHTANSSMNTSSLLDHAVRVLPASGLKGSKSGVKVWLGNTSEKTSALIDRVSDLLVGNSEQNGVLGGSSVHSPTTVDMHQALRKFADGMRLSSEVNEQIPFYYKQLFIGRQAAGLDNLRHREKETAAALQILRGDRGEASSLIVLGAPLSGKSFFAESIAKEVAHGKVIKIQAPVNGSTSISDLKRTIEKQSGGRSASTSGGQRSSNRFLYLIEDIELWWNRADPRNLALKHIIDLVNDPKPTSQFILTCNHHAFNIMQSQGLLADLTSPRVAMEVMDRSAIKNILLERHMAGALQLVLHGNDEESLSAKEFRKLCERFHETAGGVIGVALHQWLNSIRSCSDDQVQIAMPDVLELPQMEDKEWLVIISQFIIHKHLDAQRIQKLFDYPDKQKAERIIKQLYADGLVEDVMGTTYRLNPLVQMAFVEQAERCGLI